MTRRTVHEYAAAVGPRYRAASKEEKGRTLDESCDTAGMQRKAAIRLLRRWPRSPSLVRGRPRRYGPEVRAALVHIWEAGDRMCGASLAAAMPDLLPALERLGELQVSPEVRALLLQVSPSTIDRVLRRQRLAEWMGRGVRRTHPALHVAAAPRTASSRPRNPLRDIRVTGGPPGPATFHPTFRAGRNRRGPDRTPRESPMPLTRSSTTAAQQNISSVAATVPSHVSGCASKSWPLVSRVIRRAAVAEDAI